MHEQQVFTPVTMPPDLNVLLQTVLMMPPRAKQSSLSAITALTMKQFSYM